LKGKEQCEARSGPLPGKSAGRDATHSQKSKPITGGKKHQRRKVREKEFDSETESSRESESESDYGDFQPQSSSSKGCAPQRRKVREKESDADTSNGESDMFMGDKFRQADKMAKGGLSVVRFQNESKNVSTEETEAPSEHESSRKKPAQERKPRRRKRNKFVPTSTDDSDGVVESAPGTGSIRPPKFSGKGSFRNFATQFGSCSQHNGWSDVEAGYQLFSCCQDEALDHLNVSEVSPPTTSYARMMEILQQEFGPRERPEHYYLALGLLEQKPGGSLRELSKEIKRLVALAHPEATPEYRDYIATLQFRRSVTDPEVLKELHRSIPKTLSDAVVVAESIESFYKSQQSRGRGKHVSYSRMASEEREYPPSGSDVSGLMARLSELERVTKQTNIGVVSDKAGRRSGDRSQEEGREVAGHVRVLVEKMQGMENSIQNKMQGMENSIQNIQQEVSALGEKKVNKSAPPSAGNRPRSRSTDRASPRPPRSRSGSPVTCWDCGQPGHVIRDCPQGSGSETSTGTGGCFNCGNPGHFWRDCNYPQACFE